MRERDTISPRYMSRYAVLRPNPSPPSRPPPPTPFAVQPHPAPVPSSPPTRPAPGPSERRIKLSYLGRPIRAHQQSPSCRHEPRAPPLARRRFLCAASAPRARRAHAARKPRACRAPQPPRAAARQRRDTGNTGTTGFRLLLVSVIVPFRRSRR